MACCIRLSVNNGWGNCRTTGTDDAAEVAEPARVRTTWSQPSTDPHTLLRVRLLQHAQRMVKARRGQPATYTP